MPSEANAAKALFLAALEKTTAAERATFLDEACTGDAALRQRVESLLQAHGQPDSLLDQPAIAPVGASEDLGRTVALAPGAGASAGSDLALSVSSRTEVDGPGGAAAEALALLAPGQEPDSLGRLDHYEVLQVVGHGGMGMVFKARDTSLERVVAIKMLAPQLAASGTARKRFEREAKAAAAIAHEHVVDIHAVESAGPTPYLVMEFVGGITLEERIRQGGPLDLKEILRIGMQAARGLAAAHAQGLIHRDIKPGNILLENGIQRVKLTDFGLARAADDASLTQSGVIAGTPLYMSPEQAQGEAVDHRSDLFSLGSVLYALCTGHPPFRAGNTMAILKRVCEDTPRPIQEINPDIPGWLCAIVSKLMAKEASQRFQSATEVAELFSQHLAHLQQPQVIPRPATVVITGRSRPARRWKRLAAAAAFAAVVVLVVVGLRFYPMRQPDVPGPAPGPAPQRKDQPLTVEERAKLPSPLDQRRRDQIPRPLLALAGGGDPNLAAPELVAMPGDVRKFQLPDNGSRGFPGCSDDGKLLAVPCGQNIVLYDARTGEPLRTFVGHTNRVFTTTFNHDGKLLVSGAGDGTVRLWDVGTGQTVTTCLGHAGVVFGVVFSADNKRLLTASGDRTGRMWEVETGKELFALEGHTDGLLDVAFSPDGKHLASAGFDGTARVWDAETGKEKHCLKGHTRYVQKVAFSPDGKLLASGGEGEAILWEAGTWQRRQTLPTAAGWLGFTPDGQTLLAANHNTGGAVHTLTRWEPATGKEIASFPLQSQGSYALYTLSADGKTLFATRDNPDVPYVRSYDATTGKETPLHGHDGRVCSMAVHPDGKLLASAGQDHLVRLWDLGAWKAGAPQPPVRVLEGHNDFVRGLAFSLDGKLLASASGDQTICLWDVDSGQVLRTLNGGDVFRMEFSRDGRTLAAGCPDGGVRLWDLADKQRDGALLCKHPGRVRCVTFSPDGKLLASGGEDRQLWITDVETGRALKKFTLAGFVNDVMFAADGKTLAAVADAPDTAVHLWNVADWKESQLPGHTGHVQSVEFSPVAPLLASCSFDGTVRFWDLSTTPPRSLAVGVGPVGNIVWQARFTPEGRYLATANNNGTLSLLKVPSVPKPYDPGPARALPDPVELARRPSPADALKREDIPADLLVRAGGGDPEKTPPELAAVLPHSDRRVLAVAVSPDGKYLASAGEDNTAKLWSLANGKLLHTLTGHQSVVFDLAFGRPAGKDGPGWLLATAGAGDRTVKLWDVDSGKELRTLTGHAGDVRHVAFAPDGSRLASCDPGGTIRLWDPRTGKLLRVLQGPATDYGDIAFSPDGLVLAAAGANGLVHLWDLSSGWLLGTLTGHQGGVRGLAFLPDGRTLASSGQSDRALRLWDLAARKPKRTLEGTRSTAVKLSARGDGRLLASDDSEDGTVRLWDVTTNPPRQRALRLFPAPTRFVHGVTLTPEGRYLATANPDGTVYLLRLAECGEVYEVPPDPVELQPRAALPAHEGVATWAAFSADGKTLASAGKDGTVKLRDPAAGKERLALPAHQDGVRVCAVAPDGKTLATAGFDGIIRLWDADGKKRHELPGHRGGVAALLFAPNGGQLLSGGADGCVRFWNVDDGMELKQIDASRDWITSLSLTPDGKSLATSGNDGTVRLWDLQTNKERTALPQRHSACFAPDGKRLAVATPGQQIKLLDADSLEVRLVLSGHTERPDDLCFSGDGKLLASCSADGAIRVWDARRGHVLASLHGHKGRVWTVALTADGKCLAAGDEEGKLLLWDLSGLLGQPAR